MSISLNFCCISAYPPQVTSLYLLDVFPINTKDEIKILRFYRDFFIPQHETQINLVVSHKELKRPFLHLVDRTSSDFALNKGRHKVNEWCALKTFIWTSLSGISLKNLTIEAMLLPNCFFQLPSFHLFLTSFLVAAVHKQQHKFSSEERSSRFTMLGKQ